MLRNVVKNRRDLALETTVVAAQTINGDGIDVLIDVDYHKSRIEILTLRPAHVQVYRLYLGIADGMSILRSGAVILSTGTPTPPRRSF